LHCIVQMAESEVTEDYFSVYVDWVPPTSTNESSSDHHRTLSSVGDAFMCIVATILSVITADGNLPVDVSLNLPQTDPCCHANEKLGIT